MRIGEIKYIVEKATNSAGQIEIESEDLYGGQAVVIRNFGKLIDAMQVLKEQKWNTGDFGPVEEIIDRYDSVPVAAQLSSQDAAVLTTYINNLNASMPVFVGMLNTVVVTQAEQAVNIKIGESATGFKQLNALNDKLDDVLKRFTIDGSVEVVGFDKGSSWYIVLLTGVETYHAFIAALDIAKRYFDTSKTYYESKRAKVDYEASLKEDDKPTDAGRKAYAEKHVELELREEVAAAVEKIENLNGHTSPEVTTKLVKATKELIAVMGDGVEFHLSLNPPDYVAESGNRLTIDYTKIPQKPDKKLPSTTKNNKAKPDA